MHRSSCPCLDHIKCNGPWVYYQPHQTRIIHSLPVQMLFTCKPLTQIQLNPSFRLFHFLNFTNSDSLKNSPKVKLDLFKQNSPKNTLYSHNIPNLKSNQVISDSHNTRIYILYNYISNSHPKKVNSKARRPRPWLDSCIIQLMIYIRLYVVKSPVH